jgi:WD40 repeat protein/tRNA A-37 threonylcarbamoyl transferase component Bud32
MNGARTTCPECGKELPEGTSASRCPHCLIGLGLEVADATESRKLKSEIGNRFGDYDLLEEIARGGMGVVYKARQRSLNRLVALKMMLSGPFAQPEFVQRFRAEAEAIAQLQHPSIVAIHEVGEHEGQPYFTMDFVQGRTLAEIVRDGPLGAKRAATYLKAIAEAVHHAHQHGILHRDLKPSNVLIDADDQPRITDFGLAKRLDTSQPSTFNPQLTLTGQVLGSPNYLAPEQAGGTQAKVGPTSDVYGLGAMLYHLMTGRPPFQADSLTTLLRQVMETEPVAPRLLNASIPRDLETICLKCLEKEPDKRYATAQLLADELGRFLRGESILARPVSRPEKVWRWCRRKPALATALGAVVFVSVFGFAGILTQWRQTQRANVAAERREYAANIGLVQSLIADQEFDRAREILDVRSPERYRSWEWGWLERQCHQDLMTLAGDSPAARHFAVFDPATRFLATDGGLGTNTVLVWDFATGQRIRTLVGHSDWVYRAAFSRDGRQLAASSPWGRFASIWDVATGREWRQLPHPDGVPYVAYSPDGKRLLTTCWDGKVRAWDTERWTLLYESPQYGDHVYCAEFSPDGRRIAYAGGYYIWAHSRVTSVRVWDLESREVRSLEGHTRCVLGVAWNPKGDRLASCGWDGQVILWEVATWQPLARLESGAKPRALLQLSFSPDGQSLAIAGTEFPAHPWAQVLEVPTLRVRYDLAGHAKPAFGLAYSRDGQYLATASADGTVKVWPTEPLPPYLSLEGHDQPVWAVAFSPNGTYVATGSLDQTAKVWDAKALVSGRCNLPLHLRVRNPCAFKATLPLSWRWPGARTTVGFSPRARTNPRESGMPRRGHCNSP